MDRLRMGGYSLVELLCSLTTLAILALITSTSWEYVIHKLRVDASVNRFTTSLWHARSEAIRRGSWVVLERLDDCPQHNWSCGWMTYEDRNNNAFLDKEDKVIHMTDPLHAIRIRVNGNSLRQRIRLTPNGTSLAVLIGSFFFEHENSQACVRIAMSSSLRWRREPCA